MSRNRVSYLNIIKNISVVSTVIYFFVLPVSKSYAFLQYGNYVQNLRTLNIYNAPTDDRFAQFLAVNYKSFALYQKDFMRDADDAEHFAKKAILSYSGERPNPERLSDRRVPVNHLVDLDKAADDLNFMLSKDVIESYPLLVAEAQVKFDCWVEKAEEDIYPSHINECKGRFLQAINILYAKMDDTCVSCDLEKKELKRKVRTLEDRNSLEDFKGKMPSIPDWHIPSRLSSEPPKAYAVDLPDVFTTKDESVKKDILATNEKIDRLEKQLKQFASLVSARSFEKGKGGSAVPVVPQVINNVTEVDTSDIEERLGKLSFEIAKLAERPVSSGKVEKIVHVKSDDGKTQVIDMPDVLPLSEQVSKKDIDELETKILSLSDVLAKKQNEKVYEKPQTQVIQVKDNDYDKLENRLAAIQTQLAKKRQEPVMVRTIEPKKPNIDYLQPAPEVEFVDEPKEEVVEEVREVAVVPEPQPVIEEKPEPVVEEVVSNLPQITFPIEIFFDLDKDKVDPQFAITLEQIGELMNSDNNMGLVLEGHADSSGSKKHNMDLSLRRAKNVQNAVSAYGLDVEKFTVIPKGEGDLKIPTPDGVREPENRRVKIIKVER